MPKRLALMSRPGEDPNVPDLLITSEDLIDHYRDDKWHLVTIVDDPEDARFFNPPRLMPPRPNNGTTGE